VDAIAAVGLAASEDLDLAGDGDAAPAGRSPPRRAAGFADTAHWPFAEAGDADRGITARYIPAER
jgi:hypothetical protein